MTRLIIVGESPSAVDNDPPMGPTSVTGRRVSRWIAGIDDVVKVNLFVDPTPGPWSRELRAIAAQRAGRIVDENPIDSTYVCLGRSVGAAFARLGLIEKHEPFFSQSGCVVIIPHPSGTNRWWNSAQNRADADAWWAGLRDRLAGQLRLPAVG